MNRRMQFSVLLAFAVAYAFSSRARASDFDDYNLAAEQHNRNVEAYDWAAKEFNIERESYIHAVTWYNSLPPDQQTEFQYNRLERWCNDLQYRLSVLNNTWDELQRRKAELDRWLDELEG